MTRFPNWGTLARGGITAPPEAMAAIDELLAHPKCTGRGVLYRAEGRTLNGREALEAWLARIAAAGGERVRFDVDPRVAGPVLVAVARIAPAAELPRDDRP